MKLEGNTGLDEDELDLRQVYDGALFEVGGTEQGIIGGALHY